MPLISEIIDVGGISKDIDTVVDKIVDLEGEVTKANATPLSVKVDLAGAEGLTQLNAGIKQMQASLEQLTGAQQQYSQVMQQASQAEQQYGQKATMVIGSLVDTKLELQRVNEQIRHYEILVKSSAGATEENRAILEKYYQSQIRLKTAISSTNKEIKESVVIVNNTANSFNFLGLSAAQLERKMAYMALSFVGWGLILGPLMQKMDEFVEKIKKLSDASEAAANNAKKFQDALKEVEKNKVEGLGNILSAKNFDETKAKAALAIINDTNKSLRERVNAYKDLQGFTPDILMSLTGDQKKNGQFSADPSKVGAAIDAITRLKQAQTDLETANNAKGEIEATYKKAGLDFDNSSVRLFRANTEKKAIDAVTEAQTKYNSAYADYNALKVIDDKAKKDRKPNAKELDAELKNEEEHFKIRMGILKSQYDKKNNDFPEAKAVHEKELSDGQIEAAKETAKEKGEILDKYYGKVGESDTQYLVRRLRVAEEEGQIDNKALEDAKKSVRELEKVDDERSKKEDEAAEHLREHFAKMKQFEADAEELKSNRDASHKYAGGFSPLLSAFGFDGEFGESQKSFDRQIAARGGEQSALEANKDTELHRVRNGGMPDPAKLAKFDEDIQAKKNEIEDLNAQKEKKRDDKIIEAKKRISEETVQLAKETFDAIKTIRDNQFAAEQQQLEIQMNKVKLQSEQQMQAIDATTNFAIVKDNQKAKLAAQTAAKENEIQQKQNELALKKAIADKKSAEAGILMNTALAIIRVIAGAAELGPAGFAIGVAESAVVAAIGAAQYAAAASTPLPQFEKGGKTTTPFFRAAEGNKSEMMVTPQGKLIMANKDGIYHAPIGTEVINNAETNKMLRHMAWSNFGLPQAAQGSSFNDKNIVEELQETRDTMMQIGLMQARNQTKVIVVNQHNFYQRNKK